MTTRPITQYARSSDAELAYEVMGDGPIDLLLLSYGIPVSAHHDYPPLARHLERLATFSRVIRMDRRGMGMSDPILPDQPATLEQGAEDALAVLDAVGSQQAAILTDQGTTHIGVLLAASHPERVSKLILFHPYARGLRADDYPFGFTPEQAEEQYGRVRELMRTGHSPGFYDVVLNAMESEDPELRTWSLRASQLGGSPAMWAAQLKLSVESDVRDVLPTLRIPTLVVTRREARRYAVAIAVYVRDRIPGAELIDIDGAALVPWYPPFEPIADLLQEALTGSRPPLADDRVFATLLFTDIVSSTEHVAASGDRRWREQLDRHDAIVRNELDRHRGRLVNPTGDGVLATFDAPARAVRCAQAIVRRSADVGLNLRAGLHAGEVEQRAEDVSGIAVHIAQRVSSLAGAGDILVSRTITDLVTGSGLEFDDRGDHELKGVPGRWHVYSVKS